MQDLRDYFLDKNNTNSFGSGYERVWKRPRVLRSKRGERDSETKINPNPGGTNIVSTNIEILEDLQYKLLF